MGARLPRHGRGIRGGVWLGAAVLLLARCDGYSPPTAPQPMAGDGELFFVDQGCSCAAKPWPPIPIYVDGKLGGNLPLLGSLSISLAPGPHTWSLVGANDPNATSVTIQAGRVITVNLETNFDCGSDSTDAGDTVPEACPTPPPD